MIEIRHAKIEDTEKIAHLEKVAFPPADAADYDRMAQRVKAYPDCIWLLFDGDKLISFVICLASNDEKLCDEMYANTALHNPEGKWLMVLSVATNPQYERMGYGSRVMQFAINEAKGKYKGFVLTCKKHNIGFYEKLGFINEGLSDSQHGGATWYQMRYIFSEE